VELTSGEIVVVGKAKRGLGDGNGPSTQASAPHLGPKDVRLLEDLIRQEIFHPSMDENQDNLQCAEGAENESLKQHNTQGKIRVSNDFHCQGLKKGHG
jgi:hypothetical protein